MIDALIPLMAASASGGIVVTCWVIVDAVLHYRAAKRRIAQRAQDKHAADIHAFQPPFRRPLIRWVNGRPTTPPRLPAIACSPWLWPADRRRIMAWSGVWVQPVLEFRGAGPIVADVYEVASRG